MTLRLLSAGAAKSLVSRMPAEFGVEGVYGSVLATLQAFEGGAPCDILILSDALVRELLEAGKLLPGSAAPIGTVRTSVAVFAGGAMPDIATPAALRTAFMAAPSIYLSDTVRSTAGLHVAEVLQQLGIAEIVAARLRVYPNGEAAMRALAQDPQPRAIGSTQATEILATPGVTLVGPLPPEHGLSTVYSAAVSATSVDSESARRFIAALTGPALHASRHECGFHD
jgi:molybdate transport system substrate-binding protein